MSLDDFARVPLLFGPSPVHPLPRLSAALGGAVEIWAKREDCNSGIAFGGNKVRKLEYLVAEALAQGCDTLVSIGGVQSNHTRQVTGVACHLGLKAVTVQEHWVDWPDPDGKAPPTGTGWHCEGSDSARTRPRPQGQSVESR
jgi:1-aminocyclopropane-1-carboxylate deaminase